MCYTDPEGNAVDFERDCDSLVARGLNATYGDFENVWASGTTSRVGCETSEELIEKIAYTMANPVEAGLVRYGRSWPGVRHAWPQAARRVKRPPRFFRGPEQGGNWPDEVTLEFARPPGYEALSDEELAARIAATIEERENGFRRDFDREGRRFLGRRQVLAQSRHDRPRTREPRFGISPRVACRDKWRRIQRLQANKVWDADYRDAMRRWRAGDRTAVFPGGTYQMRRLHGVICAMSPD